jgi:hypothetical protein
MSDSIRESVDNLIAEFREATNDREITVAEAQKLGQGVVDLLSHSKDPDAKTVLVEAVEKLFDSYVVPHNFPRVPDVLERWIESGARSQIRPMVESFYDFIVGPPHAA